MADEAIIQTVVLQGQDDIKAGFATIQRAGEQMFKSLEAASGASPLQKFALGITGTVAAVTAITAGLFKWAESAANATVEMGRLAEASGTTIENMSTLAGALNIDTEKFAGQLNRLAVRVESEWKDIQKSQKDAANLIIGDTLAIQNAYLSLERATVQLANADKTASNLQIANANSVKSAQLSLTEAIERQRIAEGGAVDPDFNERINREKAALAVKQARLALSEAQKKADEEATLAANKLAQSAADAATAQLNLSKAQEQAAENSKNSIANLTKFVENLASGVTDANLKVNVNADNVIKGLIASIGPGISALHDLKGSFTDVASAPPALQSVLLKLADVFHNTDDAVLKTSVAVALFGRGVGQQMVEELSKGSAEILKAQQRLKDLGLELTKNDLDVGKNLVKSVETLGSTLSILSKQFGLAFAPATTGVINSINSAVEQTSGTVREFGQAIDRFATPALAGFISTITGGDLTKNFKLSPEQLINAKEWQDTFTSIKNIAVGAFSAIGIVAVSISNVINNLFGREVTSGLEIGLAALIVKFGGFYGILVVVGTALDKITGGFVTRALGAIVDLLGLAGQGLAAIYDRLTGKIDTTELKRVLDEVDKKAREVAKSVFDGTKKPGEDLVNNMAKAEDDVLKGVVQMQEKVGAELAKGSPAAKNAAASVSGIGDAAVVARTKVKDLASEIVLLDAAKGFNQPSAGGTIEVKSVTKDTLKGTGGDAAKSFGQATIEANKATAAAENLFKEFSEVDGVIVSIGDRSFDELDQSLSRLAKPATDFEKRWSEAIKTTLSEFERIAEPKPIELPAADTSKFTASVKKAIDPSEFGKLADIETPTEKFFLNLDTALVNFVAGVPDKIKNAFSGIGDSLSQFDGFGKKLDEIFGRTKERKLEIDTSALDEAGQSVDDLEQSLTTLSETQVKVTPTVDLSQVDQVTARISEIFNAGVATMVSPFRTVVDGIITEFNRVSQVVDALIAKISGINVPTGGGGDIGGGFAAGGLFSGKPGTDTNLAWLSDFEYIMNPNATRRWGVQFMNMINKMDVRGVVNWANRFTAPKFSTGGLVQWMNANMSPTMVPRFAGGGLNVSPSPQQFAGHFAVDLRTDKGTFRVMATTNTAKELQRLSASERLSSAGPPPNWVGRRGR